MASAWVCRRRRTRDSASSRRSRRPRSAAVPVDGARGRGAGPRRGSRRGRRLILRGSMITYPSALYGGGVAASTPASSARRLRGASYWCFAPCGTSCEHRQRSAAARASSVLTFYHSYDANKFTAACVAAKPAQTRTTAAQSVSSRSMAGLATCCVRRCSRNLPLNR